MRRLSPVLLGLIVGYPKYVSWIRSSRGTFSVRHVGAGAPFLAATFEAQGERFRLAEKPDLLNALSMLQDPIFSRSLVSPEIFTYIDWQFNEMWGWGQWETASVTVLSDLPGLPANKYSWSGSSDGLAIRVSIPWVLAGPLRVRSSNRSRSPASQLEG